MVMEKATYSYKKVNECILAIKGFSNTVSKRGEHFTKMLELEKLYDMCFEKTGCTLFESDIYTMKDYHKAVNDGLVEKTRRVTKKELDILLKSATHFLKEQIFDIYKMMEYGEVNTID